MIINAFHNYSGCNSSIVVNVESNGVCGSCPFSRMTLKNGVEDAMKKAIPEVKSVEAVNM